MSKRNRPADTSISKQLALIDTEWPEGSLDISLNLKQQLSAQLKGWDRYLVAAIISRATCKDLSKEMLDKILSSDPSYQPSMLQATAICALTANLKAFQICLEPLGSDVLDPADRDLIELARLMEKQKQIETEIMLIQKRRGIK